jgi:hypothetical protein
MHCLEDGITADGAVATAGVVYIPSLTAGRITGLRRMNDTITAYTRKE